MKQIPATELKKDDLFTFRLNNLVDGKAFICQTVTFTHFYYYDKNDWKKELKRKKIEGYVLLLKRNDPTP